MANPENRENTGRNPDGTFKAGVSGNPGGRPRNTLKSYVSKMFQEMSDEEKAQWLKDNKVSADLIWKMAEGNPDSKTETTSVKEYRLDDPELDKYAEGLVEHQKQTDRGSRTTT